MPLKGDSLSQNNIIEQRNNNLPSNEEFNSIYERMQNAGRLVDDIVLKKYLTNLSNLDIVPLPQEFQDIGKIRFFRITEMVYQGDEYSTHKFATVFDAVQNLNCGVFLIAKSNGISTEFYMGVRTLDRKHTVKSLKDTLRNALCGQFPGARTEDLLEIESENILLNIRSSKNIASVSCVAQEKEEGSDNDSFVQGLEKLVIAMQGQKYTMVILARSTSRSQLSEVRRAYESIYTNLSPFASMNVVYGTNFALNLSNSISKGMSFSTSHTDSSSLQTSYGISKSENYGQSISQIDNNSQLIKAACTAALGLASLVTAPLTGGASFAAAGAIIAGQVAINSFTPKTQTKSKSNSTTCQCNNSKGFSISDTFGITDQESSTVSRGTTTGESRSTQLTMKNKAIIDTLHRIDEQIKRLDQFESLGMWENAAYFLADNQETAEMAAGTYRAIMRGEKSGLELSGINFWGNNQSKKLPALRNYIANFLHPVFKYYYGNDFVPITAASLVSGKELAIHMGLPRKSVCGFPVIEHADFGKEVIRYKNRVESYLFEIGKICDMGKISSTSVYIDRESLSMHTFITGSTGSGKSNAVYQILSQIKNNYQIPFLVIEPAKGEYKNIFGCLSDVVVYGTNPKKFDNILNINPFRFSHDIHVLEHLERLVEVFNVCWPMYAAMPAVLKDAIEKAYISVGWNLETSENPQNIFPTFEHLLKQIYRVIESSEYSTDSKSDYIGALSTRIRSLTTGLNRLIFCDDDIDDFELFDKNVIVDLSRIGSMETKALIMGIIIMRLNEYRMSSSESNKQLSHITVLEEAHNILKRTSTEQCSESSNVVGKSVEMLSNSIAEMRTYGEGFIIVDQSPNMLDMSAIRNTNTKIILRLPDKNDRELVGFAANLRKDQINELTKLGKGIAAVYQSDWVEPVLTKISKCSIKENFYLPLNNSKFHIYIETKRQIIFMLIQGRMKERLEFDIKFIKQNIDIIKLDDRHKNFINGLILEYENDNSLTIWDDAHFCILANVVCDVLNLYDVTKNFILTSIDNKELSKHLYNICLSSIPNISNNVAICIAQCLMRNFVLQNKNDESVSNIYNKWIDYVVSNGGLI